MRVLLPLALLCLVVSAALASSPVPRLVQACGDAGPFDFDTHERLNYDVDYAQLVELAAAGKAVPSVFSVDGEQVDVTYQGLESGPRGARTAASTAVRVPPTLYKAMVWIESSWANGSGTVPYGGVGPTLRSFDCGYGLGQITTGMGNYTGTSSARQAVIGTHPLFNIAEGIRILADKWNSAPESRPVAGTGDPTALEDWYYAVWSYQGFWFGNHPFYPLLDPLRGGDENSPLYHCYEPQAYSWQNGKYMYGDYAYQERVYGCMKYPPRARDLSAPAAALTQSLRNGFQPGDQAVVDTGGDCLNIRPAPGLGGVPRDCLEDGTRVTILGGPVAADGYDWWEVEAPSVTGWGVDDYLVPAPTGPTPTPSPTPAPGPPPQPKPPPTLDGPRLWSPVEFRMPEFSHPAIARAFKPSNFETCETRGFAGGCPAMDFPTTIPEWNIVTHRDPTPPVDPSLVGRFLGAPSLTISGPQDVILSVAQGAEVGSIGVEVRNAGTGVGPFLVRTSHPWITVKHATDPPLRTLDAGVAVGKDIEVVIKKDPRQTQVGYVSSLRISLDRDHVPGGTTTGTVVIEPLLGGGASFTIRVTAINTGEPPPPPAKDFHVGLPALGRD